MQKLQSPSLLYLAVAIIVLAALLAGYLLLSPMSGNFARYLLWSMTPAAASVSGSVKAGDANIHYVSYGSGPPVLLLHGGLSNRLSWFSQLPWLVASGRRVVVLDTRGHGLSGLGKRELSYRLLAADAIQVLDKLNIGKTDVIGWSDGGNTALMLGRYWPERIERIIAISANFSPSGLTPEAREDTYRQSSGLTYWLNRWWTGAGERLEELEHRIKRLWRSGPKLKPADLRAIGTPTEVIIGEHDVVSVQHARLMVRSLLHGTLAVVPGGHSTPVTAPRRVNALIAAFLKIPAPD